MNEVKKKYLNENRLRGMTIDIGVKTFTMYVEEFNRRKISKSKLDDIFKNGNCICFLQYDISALNLTNLLDNLHTYLKDNVKLFTTLDFICIEQQLDVNPLCQVIEENVRAFIIINFGTSKEVISYPAKRKTIRLKAPKNIQGAKNKPKRKIWAIEKALEILELREDKKSIKFLKKKQKLDDFSDCICMMQAFKIDVFKNKKL